VLVAASKGMTGADIKAICTEAGMFAIRDDREIVHHQDFQRAIRKIALRGGTDRIPPGIYG
ncbi:MAG: proteasome-activating nucleotidase, partial [Candidatus Thorarchaeota archaeon]